MVIGSNPIRSSVAAVAQLVEHNLAKVRVAGSNPVCRSICDNSSIGRASSFQVGGCRFESCLSLNGSLVELVTISHCHCEGHGFDSHTNRTIGEYINWLDYVLWEHEVVGSSPASPTNLKNKKWHF